MNIYLVRYDGNKNIIKEEVSEIIGGSSADTILRIEAPKPSPQYTCNVSFELYTGSTVSKSTEFKTSLVVDDVTYYRYEYEFDTDITSVTNSQQATPLLATPIFTDAAANVVEPQNIITMSVYRTVNANRPVIAPDEVARLDGRIDEKRDRNPVDQTQKTTPASSDVFSFWGNSETDMRKINYEDLKNSINEDVVGRIAYTTLTDTGVDDPVAGFGNFRKLVESTLDPDYPTAGGQIDFVTTLVDTYEPITSSSYPLGFFRGTNLTNLQFTNSFTLKTTSGVATLKIDYYKVTTGDLTGTLLGSTEISFTNTTFTLQSKAGVLAGPFSIDPDAGDFIVGRVYGKADSSGITLSAQIGGTEPKTFTSWQIPSGDFSASKMNVILNPVAGNLVEQEAGGNTKDAGIPVLDIARLSQVQTFAENVVFSKDLDVGNNLSVTETITCKQLFVLNGNQTDLLVDEVNIEDPIVTYAKGNVTPTIVTGHEWELGGGNKWAVQRLANGEFRLGLTTDLKLLAYIQDNPTENITVYDSASGELQTKSATDIKTLLNIQTSDVENLDTILASKISNITFKVNGTEIGAGTIINIIEGGDITQDGTEPNQFNWSIFGTGGLGEGLLTLSSLNADAITNVPLAPQTLALNIEEQSDDTNVFEVFDKNDGVKPNTIEIKKNATVQEGNAYRYRLTANARATNTNVGVAPILTFEIVGSVDGVVATDTAQIGAASIQNPTITNNFSLDMTFKTNPLEVTQDYTIRVSSNTNPNVNLTLTKIKFTSWFTTGELVTNLMSKLIYDTNSLGKVDISQITDKVRILPLTLDVNADAKTTLTGTLENNQQYEFKMPTIVSGSNVRISLDNGVTYKDVLDRDGLTNLIGTQVSEKQLTLKYNGTAYVLEDLELIVDNHETRITTLEAQDVISQAQVNDNTTDLARLRNELRVASLITDDAEATFYRDYINNNSNSNVFEETFVEIFKSNYPTLTTVINDLTDTTGLVAGMKLTVQDAINKEEVTIISVDSTNQITISALVNSYNANVSLIGRSTDLALESWTVQTDMDVLPENDTPAWTKNGTGGSSVSLGLLTLSASALAIGYILNIVGDTTKTKRVRTKQKQNAGGGNAVPIICQLDDGTKVADIRYNGDNSISFGGGGTLSIDTTIDHTYEVIFDKTLEARYYVDGILQETVPYANLAAGSAQRVLFGYFGAGTATAIIDYVYINNDLDANPDLNFSVYDKRFFIETVKDIDLIVLENEIIDTGLDSTVTIEASVSTNDNETPVSMIEDTDAKEINGTQVNQFFSLKSASAGDKVVITKTYTNVDTDNYIGGKVFKV